MWLFSRARAAAQSELHTPRHIKGLHPTGSWPVFAIACIAALALVFSAGAQNVAHAYTLGLASGPFRALVLAVASVGASALGPCAWLAVFRGRGFGTRTVALVMAVGCLAYAATCSLGFVAGARSEAVSGQLARQDDYQDWRAIRDAARAELASLKGQAPFVLKRRAELAKLLSSETSTKAAAPAALDTQAAALAFYVRAAGYQVSDASMGTWLNLGTVLFLELAAALSLTVASALRPTRPEAPPAAVSPQPTPVAAAPENAASAQKTRDSGDDNDKPAPPKPKGRGGRPSAVSPEAAMARLRKAGGQATGSVARVGKLLGVRSKSTAHRLLHRMSAAGQVQLSASPQGISVALV